MGWPHYHTTYVWFMTSWNWWFKNKRREEMMSGCLYPRLPSITLTPPSLRTSREPWDIRQGARWKHCERHFRIVLLKMAHFSSASFDNPIRKWRNVLTELEWFHRRMFVRTRGTRIEVDSVVHRLFLGNFPKYPRISILVSRVSGDVQISVMILWSQSFCI